MWVAAAICKFAHGKSSIYMEHIMGYNLKWVIKKDMHLKGMKI